jgi:hypothetical protein
MEAFTIMLRKMILLVGLALTVVTTVAQVSYPQYPIPSCFPCDGGGGGN